jgi:hypothetical protein
VKIVLCGDDVYQETVFWALPENLQSTISYCCLVVVVVVVVVVVIVVVVVVVVVVLTASPPLFFSLSETI